MFYLHPEVGYCFCLASQTYQIGPGTNLFFTLIQKRFGQVWCNMNTTIKILKKPQIFGFLVGSILLISCKNKSNSHHNNDSSQNETSISHNDHSANFEWEEKQIFIEEKFPKFSSCDEIYINYPNDSIKFIEQGNIHQFKISEVNDIYSSSILGLGGPYMNLFITETSIIEREEKIYSDFAGVIEEDNPILKKHQKWNKEERERLYEEDENKFGPFAVPISHSKFDPKRKNPYEDDLTNIKRHKFNLFVAANRGKYEKMTVIDYSKKRNTISKNVLSGKDQDCYIQIAFNNSLIKFEVFDNLEYDEKYNEFSRREIDTCLKYLLFLKNMKMIEIAKKEEQIEKLRRDSLMRVKTIE
jgi:hypothetical protein